MMRRGGVARESEVPLLEVAPDPMERATTNRLRRQPRIRKARAEVKYTRGGIKRGRSSHSAFPVCDPVLL